MSGEGVEHVDVVICPDGPLLLRGRHVVQDATGEVHETTRPVSAVCRCLRSADLPWCDGTHRLLPPDQRPDASKWTASKRPRTPRSS